MITLEKIIELDDKITRAVKVIEELRNENKLLKDKLGNNREKIVRLEELLSTFKDDQDEIEAGIKNAVETLNNMLSQGDFNNVESTKEPELVETASKESPIIESNETPIEAEKNVTESEIITEEEVITTPTPVKENSPENSSELSPTDMELEEMTRPDSEEISNETDNSSVEEELDIF